MRQSLSSSEHRGVPEMSYPAKAACSVGGFRRGAGPPPRRRASIWVKVMNVAITGSGGFIGSHLSKRLEMFGHRVTPLRRYLFAQEGVDCLAQALAGCHAVINLAGAPIDRRWTDAYKRELVESRIMTTRKLVEAVNRLHEPPGVMISASAVGYYGSSGGCHGELDAPEADSFLAELCVAWEKEAGLVNSSVRLVLTRFGVVLSPDGGALPEMMRPARFGVTATAGNPDHLFSWVALEDLADALVFIMGRQDISGPVNVTAPERTTNREFYRAAAEHFHTRLSIRVPDAVLRLLMGEASQVITGGQCAVPETLMREGFTFQYPDIRTFFNKAFCQIMSMIQTIVTSLFHGHSVKTDPMPDFNLERYLGEWHEIARLENWFERGLSRVLARYDLREDGSISVVNSGYDVRTGERKEVCARAVAGDAPNHLKVYFVPLVYGRYEVAFLDENYTRAVVSGGSLNYLWLLARSPQLKDDELQPMLHCAEKLGYDTSRLIYANVQASPDK